MFSVVNNGSFKNTESFLKKALQVDILRTLRKYGQIGADALTRATAVQSGLAASSWDYEVLQDSKGFTIFWFNRDVENGFKVVIMLQYGYATGTGGYVQGRDFINPAIRPIFDRIAAEVWTEVTSK